MNSHKNSQRIAKNTLMLYIRMFLSMLVTLYTSRVILKVLGVEDFGIYNVVGGVVSMIGFLNASLSNATSRFITFEIGKSEKGDLQKVFRCTMTVHYLMALCIFVLSETIGLWFVLEKLVIPLDRLSAAMWVYQCSIITVLVTIISAPYNALIIAFERMTAFAYISIVEVCCKLVMVLLLTYATCDKLIAYAVLLLLLQFGIRMFYTLYCRHRILQTSSKILWDKTFSREIFSYAGWTLNGHLAVVGYTQGINILLNLFFGPVVNAARAVAVQVQSAVTLFFTNFQTAIRPQVIKSYAQGDFSYMHRLIIGSSKYSFYLMLIIGMPLLVNTEYVLSLWLGQVPEHSVAFVRLMLLTSMNYALSMPTLMAIHATGNIKCFQIIEGALLLTVVPAAWLLLKFACISAEGVLFTYFLIETITQFARVYIIYPQVGLLRKKYFTEVLYPISKVLFPLSIAGYALYSYLPVDSFGEFLRNSFLCFALTVLVVGSLGLQTEERKNILLKLKEMTINKNNKFL